MRHRPHSLLAPGRPSPKLNRRFPESAEDSADAIVTMVTPRGAMAAAE